MMYDTLSRCFFKKYMIKLYLYLYSCFGVHIRHIVYMLIHCYFTNNKKYIRLHIFRKVHTHTHTQIEIMYKYISILI